MNAGVQTTVTSRDYRPDVNSETPKTISEVADELERIQQDLFRLQTALEKMEKAEIASRAKGQKG